MVALGWIAAGHLYEIQGRWEDADTHGLAKLEGRRERADRPPGKIVLVRRIRAIWDYLVMRAALEEYRAQPGRLPPTVIAWLGEAGAAQL